MMHQKKNKGKGTRSLSKHFFSQRLKQHKQHSTVYYLSILFVALIVAGSGALLVKDFRTLSNTSTAGLPSSSELGIAAPSPLGENGGFAVPASCPSDLHDAPVNYGQACGTCGGTIQCAGTCSRLCDCAHGTDASGNVLTTLRPSTTSDPNGGKVVPGGQYKAVSISNPAIYTCFKNTGSDTLFVPGGSEAEFRSFWMNRPSSIVQIP